MCRWGLTSYVVHAIELTPGLRERLPPTDSRLRRDLAALERARYDEVPAALSLPSVASLVLL